MLTSTVSAEAFPISGTIANDGTFQATTQAIGTPPNGVLMLSLTGSSPRSATPSTWTGTYSLTFTPGTSGVSCSIAQSGSFVANAIASVTGTYTGAVTSVNAPFGMAADVSVQLTQGAPTLITRGNTSYYQLPLTGSLTIANSPCFTAPVTIQATAPAFISGDSLQLAFLTTNTQGEGLNGTLTDPTANTVSGLLASIGTASCGGGIGAYTFTRR